MLSLFCVCFEKVVQSDYFACSCPVFPRRKAIEEAVFSSLCIFANFVIDDHIYVGFGEGDGTPLQYSCLENPMDGGAW